VSASNNGIPITLNENSRAGQAFRNIARRLNGEEVPFLQMGDSGGFMQRLARLFSGSDAR
jgi:septum site-determining protein MinD